MSEGFLVDFFDEVEEEITKEEPKEEWGETEMLNANNLNEDVKIKVEEEIKQEIEIVEDLLELSELTPKPPALDQVQTSKPKKRNKSTHVKEKVGGNLKKRPLKNEAEWFECDKCEFKSRYKCSLKQHVMHSHREDEIEWFNCDKCDYKAKQKINLQNHVNARHLREAEINWFKCEKCDFRCKCKGNLKYHVKNKHLSADEVKWFKCGKCVFKTKLESSLKRHTSRHFEQGPIKWFYCDKCDYRSYQKIRLEKHIMTFKHENTATNRWLKGKCKGNLKHHVKNKHLSADEVKWFKCGKCVFKTKLESSLKRHTSRHFEQGPIKWFYCDKCDYRSDQKIRLEKHIMTFKHENTATNRWRVVRIQKVK